MPVTINFSTIPGQLQHKRDYTAVTLDLMGPSLSHKTVSMISTVPDIKAAVAAFGKAVQADHPDASFYVSVRLAKGARKPNGYDAAKRGNGLGQENFLLAEPAEPDEPTESSDPSAD